MEEEVIKTNFWPGLGKLINNRSFIPDPFDQAPFDRRRVVGFEDFAAEHAAFGPGDPRQQSVRDSS